MSLSVPSRRLFRGAPALAAPPTTTTTSSLLPALHALSLSASPNNAPSSSRPLHTTPANQWFWSRNKKNQPEGTSLEQQVSGTHDTRTALLNKLTSRLQGPAIFEDEVKPNSSVVPPDFAGLNRAEGTYTGVGTSLAKEHLGRAADPDPRSRARWERKMAIRAVHRGTDPFSREPRAARIARTERQLTSASPPLATSTKKLVHLAHQIQGKTVADALVQMRFSKKKMAQEVRHQLEIARDLAVVERGMGLGAAAAAKGEDAEGNTNGKPLEIQTKDGKWIKIDDPTRMYVAEAWVNRRTPRGKQPDYRARGRMNIKINRSTSISIVLKEEKTRIREAAEREAKKLRQGPWVHLPDRPVTAQRQWYSW